jgi:uncharacterized membrane protein
MNPALRVIMWMVVGASLLANAIVFGLYLRFEDVRSTLNGGGGGFTDLPRPVRDEFRAALRDNPAALQQALRDLGQARRDMFLAAAARPYDRAAVEVAMERVRIASAALQVAGQEMLLQAFEKAARDEGQP